MRVGMAKEIRTPWNAAWHLNAELSRVLDLLANLLSSQRARGRTPLGDPVQGLLIEHGEAEGLIRELADSLDQRSSAPPRQPAAAPDARREIRDRVEAGTAQGGFLPLRHAERAFDLSAAEYDAFLLTLAVEHDSRFGRIVAYLNDHAGHTRPTVGLALALAGLGPASPPTPAALVERPIIRDGLLDLEGDGPLPGLAMKLSDGLLQRVVHGTPATQDRPVFPPEPGLLRRLVLDDETRRKLTAWAEAKRRGDRVPSLLFFGPDGSGRTTAARGVASEAGLAIVVARLSSEKLSESLRVARREARWHAAAVLLHANDSVSDSAWPAVWREVRDLPLPVLFAAPEPMVPAIMSALPDAPAGVAIGRRDANIRFHLWKALLPADSAVGDDDLNALAAKFRITPRAIAQAIQRAAANRSLAPAASRRFNREALETACRDVAAAGLATLAQKLPLPYERKDLVVPAELEAELDLAIAWVRHEKQVLDTWGFRNRVTLGRGLTALFGGPSGTGKTMAAQVLARELGLDLYRVDLSRVMSKYIGDTEKRLADLFDRAESAVLFFDEADALFGKRSEVKDAHDRWANVEVGYLLQRIEEHDGVTVLASNRVRDMDEAFVRRFHVIVTFPMPAEPDRLRIWQGMFPKRAKRADDIDLPGVARDFELSGGEIKNAALAAAYLAAADGGPIGMGHLKRAIRREMVKSGRVLAGAPAM
jgi:AAA+ superfamily predicted ATPase